MSRLKFLLSIAIIIAVTGIAFYPSLHNDFTNWDDDIYVINNKDIRTISLKNLKEIFTSSYVSHYIPITILSYAIEYHFFKLNPYAYHTINFILHLLNCMLVFWFIYIISGKEIVGFMVALLFGIHPLHVEPVAWIAERKDVLYAFFYLSALITYLYYLKKNNNWYYVLSIFCFILSLLSKAMAITLPFVLVLLDFILSRKFNRNVFTEKFPFLILAMLFGAIAIFILPSHQDTLHNIFHRIQYASYGLLFYSGKLMLPINLSCLYPMDGISSVLLLLSPFMLAILVGILIFFPVGRKKVIFGSLFFLISIAPVLQLLPSGWAVAADRYIYIPSIGIFYFLSEGYYWLYESYKEKYKSMKIAFPFIFLVIITVLSYLTFNRCQVWKDSVTLWSDVIKNYPTIAMAYNNRGSAYLQKREVTKAIYDYSRALEINPDYLVAFDNLLRTYWAIGMKNEAQSLYKKATNTNPNYEAAYTNLGNVYWKIGKKDDAIALYKMVIALNPNNAEAHEKLAWIHYYSGEYHLAFYHLTRAIELGHRVNDGLLKLLNPYRNNSKQ